MNRRTLLAAMPAIGAVAVLPAAAAPAPFNLQHWLDTARVEDVVQYHLIQLASALHRQHGGAWRGTLIEHDGHPPTSVIICDDKAGDSVFVAPHTRSWSWSRA